MSHFAKLDSNNIVENVIVAEQDFINSGIVGNVSASERLICCKAR